jgi:hypothetical protein
MTTEANNTKPESTKPQLKLGIELEFIGPDCAYLTRALMRAGVDASTSSSQ